LSKQYIPVNLRRSVVSLAGNCCEYCLLPGIALIFPLEIDHIISEKQGGLTELHNLALACRSCNGHKGASIVGIDYKTKVITRLFDPRTQVWHDHFNLRESGFIEPVSMVGSATVQILLLNEKLRIEGRERLISNGLLSI